MDYVIILKAVGIFVLLLLNGFFVAAEFALVRVRLGQLELMVKKGSRAARLGRRILENLDVYLSAAQLGITVESLVLGAVGEPFFAEYILAPFFKLIGLGGTNLADNLSFPLAILIITFLHITIGEQAPKMMAIQKPKATTLVVAFPLHWFYMACYPFVALLNYCSNGILWLCGLKALDHGKRSATEEELRQIMADSMQGGHVTARERVLMENVLNMSDKTARQIMVPRTAIEIMLVENSLEENLAVVRETMHTRYPLCEGGLDEVLGMIHIRDLIPALSGERKIDDLRELMREVLVLPETVTADRLLTEFQVKHIHLAILIDEYGAKVGMVTLEDVLEEVFGEIQDEFDDEAPEIQCIGPQKFFVHALCPLDKFAQQFSLSIDEVEHERVDTVGGLIYEELGRVPKLDERMRFQHLELRIVKMDKHQIISVEVCILPPKEDKAE